MFKIKRLLFSLSKGGCYILTTCWILTAMNMVWDSPFLFCSSKLSLGSIRVILFEFSVWQDTNLLIGLLGEGTGQCWILLFAFFCFFDRPHRFSCYGYHWEGQGERGGGRRELWLGVCAWVTPRMPSTAWRCSPGNSREGASGCTAAPGCAVQGWELGVLAIPGDPRTSPPQGRWSGKAGGRDRAILNINYCK